LDGNNDEVARVLEDLEQEKDIPDFAYNGEEEDNEQKHV